MMSLVFTRSYEKSYILKAFAVLDEVNDGQLTKEELIQGTVSILRPQFLTLTHSLLTFLEG